MKPKLAITMGDPAGIGPEILIKVAGNIDLHKNAHLVAIGDVNVINQANNLLGNPIELIEIKSISSETLEPLAFGQLAVYPSGTPVEGKIKYGHIEAQYGQAAYESIICSIDLALNGVIDGVVTNPINKEALRASGVPQAGHTEIFAERTHTKRYAMMLLHEPLRIVHVSTHVALREACNLVKKERVLEVIQLTHQTVRRLDGMLKPIAVAGLNPHAGENGLFGVEEIEEIIPAVEKAQSLGIPVVGPLPPDTIFSRAMSGEFSAVIAMYHDQGHIPLKLAGFRVDSQSGSFTEISGVNITLGLPIIRTSVDHGTAFDLSGSGKASEASLKQAIDFAIRLCPRVD